MSLPADIDRCAGVQYDGEWREGCEDCRRREPGGRVYMEPPPVVVFECAFRIPS